MDTSIEINNNYTNIKICECDLINYYCHCKGEDELLLRLQKFKKFKRLRIRRRTCCYAIQNGHFNILNWHETVKKKPCGYEDVHHILPTKSGNLDILKILYQQNKLDFRNKYGNLCVLYKYSIFKYAVWNDYLHILKWLMKINVPKPIYCDYMVVEKIGMNCLKYLFEINEINETEDILNIENKKEIEYFKFLATCGI
jgi:hypothetical protein